MYLEKKIVSAQTNPIVRDLVARFFSLFILIPTSRKCSLLLPIDDKFSRMLFVLDSNA